MMINYYFYPGPYWTQLDAGAPIVGVAVMNPNSGPGTSKDPNYVTTVMQAQAKGIMVLGYVHTSFAMRSLAAVESDVNKYYSWYHVNGIFFDEATNTCTSSNISYYKTLFHYVKSTFGTGQRVVLNPGSPTGQCYLAISDTIVTFEGSGSAYQSYVPSGWVITCLQNGTCTRTHFWHLVYDVLTTTAMLNDISLSKHYGAGYIYVTPDVLPNPWDSLPTGTYWTDELNAAHS